MRKGRFTEAEIIWILKEAKGGAKVDDLAREHGVGSPTIYNWRAKYGGLDVSAAQRLNQILEEIRRLKQFVADLPLDKEVRQPPEPGPPEPWFAV